jgi:hypothetical protein
MLYTQGIVECHVLPIGASPRGAAGALWFAWASPPASFVSRSTTRPQWGKRALGQAGSMLVASPNRGHADRDRSPCRLDQ